MSERKGCWQGIILLLVPTCPCSNNVSTSAFQSYSCHMDSHGQIWGSENLRFLTCFCRILCNGFLPNQESAASQISVQVDDLLEPRSFTIYEAKPSTDQDSGGLPRGPESMIMKKVRVSINEVQELVLACSPTHLIHTFQTLELQNLGDISFFYFL